MTRLRTLGGTAAAVSVTAAAGGLASSGADDPWFRALRKPRFQPPGAAFPIVWTALYATIATASAQVLDEAHDAGRDDETRAFRTALAANLGLNGAWTWLFFRAHRPGLATLESAALCVSSADLARRAAAVDRRAGALLTPYVAWTAFATVLSGTIARLNRR